MKKSCYIFVIFLCFSCTKKEIKIIDIPFNFNVDNTAPSLVSSNGKLSLSWINQTKKNTAKLLYTELIDDKWAIPTKIASGNDWFVNWADFPTNAINKNILLTSHLEKSAKEKYTYDIILNLRNTNGEIIKENFLLNTDGLKAEHGFVSVIPNEEDGFLVTWLDGRNTVMEMNEGHHKAMTIRTASISKKGNIFDEIEVDGSTCDCCQTSITKSQNGPIIVYRNRSKDEIRDIYFSQKQDSVWSTPKAVFNDSWKIHGCPVNGPKIVSNKKKYCYSLVYCRK